MVPRALAACACIAALAFFGASALGATDSLAAVFAKVADKGLAVAGRAMRDGTGEVDVLSGGKITRYTVDRLGKVTSKASPLAYNPRLLEKVAFGADKAAAAAAARGDEREADVRAVVLVDEGGTPVYRVATYEANGLFYGFERYLAADGKWDGWTAAAGEPDPLSK